MLGQGTLFRAELVQRRAIAEGTASPDFGVNVTANYQSYARKLQITVGASILTNTIRSHTPQQKIHIHKHICIQYIYIYIYDTHLQKGNTHMYTYVYIYIHLFIHVFISPFIYLPTVSYTSDWSLHDTGTCSYILFSSSQPRCHAALT